MRTRAAFVQRAGGELSVEASHFVRTGDPTATKVGDLRVGFFESQHSYLSMLGKQEGGTIVPYTSSSGDRVFMLQHGLHSAGDMLSTAHNYGEGVSVIRVLALLITTFCMVLYAQSARENGPLASILGPVWSGTIKEGAVGAGTLALACIAFAAGITWAGVRFFTGTGLCVLGVLALLRLWRAGL